uniref:Uncharacterized protein n=1 Tax=Schistocephalus solidus TaxID=70667 RepID=A0A0X3NVG2_SCHSO
MSAEVSSDAVLPAESGPPEETVLPVTETVGLGEPPSKRRRRQHKKKKKQQRSIGVAAPASQSSYAEGELQDESQVAEGLEDEEMVADTPLRQPFQRIIFDEDGQACEVLLRTGLQAQVNRRHQKRLGTSSYNWSDAAELTSATPTILSVVSGRKRPPSERPGRASTASAAAKNLEVRVHRFPVFFAFSANARLCAFIF